MIKDSINDAKIVIENFNSLTIEATDKIKSVEDQLNAIGVKTELNYLVRLRGEKIEHTPINEDKWIADLDPCFDPTFSVYLGWNAFGKEKDNFRIGYTERLSQEEETYENDCVPLVSVKSKIRIKMAEHLDKFLLAAVERIKLEYKP